MVAAAVARATATTTTTTTDDKDWEQDDDDDNDDEDDDAILLEWPGLYLNGRVKNVPATAGGRPRNSGLDWHPATTGRTPRNNGSYTPQQRVLPRDSG